MSEVDIPQGETIVVPTGVTHEVTVEVPPRPELRITEVIVGPVGPQGPPGADGADGQDGQSATFMDYMYNSTETGAPSSGQVRTNATSNPPAVTAIYLSNFTSPGVDVARILGHADTGTEVDLQDKDDSSRYETYVLVGPPIDHGTFWEYPVEYVDAGLPVPAQRIWVAVLNEGTPGPQGPPGADSTVPGPQGPPGPGVPLPVYDECGDLTVWTQWGGAGVPSVQTVADGSVAVGGKVIRCVANVAMSRSVLVPFDPKALYRVKFRVRQTVDGAVGENRLYAGFHGVAADGVTLVNINGANSVGNQHDVACAGWPSLLAANGWQEFVGYVRGVAATGTWGWTGPTHPGVMHTDVRYIRPYFSINWNGNGTAEIDYVSLEVVPEPVTPLPLYDEGSSLTEWTKFGAGTGTATVEQVADSAVGGKVIRVAGMVVPFVRMPLVPFDPNALYRIKFRVRQTVDKTVGGSDFFGGFEAVGADGVTAYGILGEVGHLGHWAIHQLPLTKAQGWQELVGYVKGTTTGAGINGPTSPTTPGQLTAATRYIRPAFTANFNDGDGTVEIDYVSLEVVPEPAVTPLPLYDEGSSTTEWKVSSASPGAVLSTVQVADSAVGGRVLRVTGEWSGYRAPLTPYDPTALYRIKFRVRQVTNPTAGAGGLILGVAGVGANGVTIVSSDGTANAHPFHSVCAEWTTITAAQGWQEFVGYLKGTAATGTSAPCPSPSAPGKAHANVRYIRPQMFLNWTGPTGVAEVDYVSLEIVPSDVVTADSAEIDFSGGTGGTPLSAALTGTRSGGLVVTGNLASGGGVNAKTMFQAGDDTTAGTEYWAQGVQVHALRNGNVTWYTENILDENTPYCQHFVTKGAVRGHLDLIVDAATNQPYLQIVSYASGSVHRPIPFAMVTGLAIITQNGTTSITQTVTFTGGAAGKFTQPPVVMVAINSGNPNHTGIYAPRIFAQATTGFQVLLKSVGNITADVPIHYIAIQMTPSNGLS